jgi:hypothetical protein
MNANSTPDLIKVVRFSVAMGFSGLAGFMASIRQINPHARFAFDWIVIVALVVGWLFGYQMCRVVLPVGDAPEHLTDEKKRSRLIKVCFFGLLPCGVILLGLFTLVKDASNDRQFDYFLGFSGAVVFLTLLGYMLTKVVAFFEGSSGPADHDRRS